MDDAFDILFVCCSCREDKNSLRKKSASSHAGILRRPRGRGRSRTQRANINASFDSLSTNHHKKKITFEKNTPLESKRRKPPYQRRSRKIQDNVSRQKAHPRPELEERNHGKNHPKDLENGGTQQSGQKRRRQHPNKTKETARGEGHSKGKKIGKIDEEKYKDNKKQSLSSWKGGSRITSKRGVKRLSSKDGAMSQQRPKILRKLKGSSKRVKREHEAKTISGTTRVAPSAERLSNQKANSVNNRNGSPRRRRRSQTMSSGASVSTRTTYCSTETRDTEITSNTRRRKSKTMASKSALKRFAAIFRKRKRGSSKKVHPSKPKRKDLK